MSEMSEFQSHPLYPIARWLPLIGKPLSEIDDPLLASETRKDQTLNFALLGMHARDKLHDLYGNWEDDDSGLDESVERNYEEEDELKMVRDFCTAAIDMTVGGMIVHLCTNVVMHQIHLSEEDRRSNFHNDFVVLYPLMDGKGDDDDLHVVKQMMEYLHRPIMRQCTEDYRSYCYEGVKRIPVGKYETYIHFHWGS